ncbi:MAG: hypothetical protein LAO51_04110 [Acidobacteriia bacterium]|nr:hypothetical protein [Terriglobia bacterium]
MTEPKRAVERAVLSVLACAAVAFFFLPLFRLQVPIKHDRTVRGPDLVTEATRVVRDLRTEAETATDDAGDQEAAAEKVAESPMARRTPPAVRLTWLLALWLLGSTACAAVVPLLAIRGARGARALSAAGAVLALAALVHISLINWQVHGMFADPGGRHGFHPLDSLRDRAASGLVARFEMQPGAGLYGMAGCLAAAVAATTLISAARRVPSEPTPP